jgi:hypothetical protein
MRFGLLRRRQGKQWARNGYGHNVPDLVASALLSLGHVVGFLEVALGKMPYLYSYFQVVMGDIQESQNSEANLLALPCSSQGNQLFGTPVIRAARVGSLPLPPLGLLTSVVSQLPGPSGQLISARHPARRQDPVRGHWRHPCTPGAEGRRLSTGLRPEASAPVRARTAGPAHRQRR